MPTRWSSTDAYQEAATELVATVEQVASIVRTMIAGLLSEEYLGMAFDTDRIFRAITHSPRVESTLIRATLYPMVYGETAL